MDLTKAKEKLNNARFARSWSPPISSHRKIIQTPLPLPGSLSEIIRRRTLGGNAIALTGLLVFALPAAAGTGSTIFVVQIVGFDVLYDGLGDKVADGHVSAAEEADFGG